jgi:pimeloyl-ACP methyl ester carboxylesterase
MNFEEHSLRTPRHETFYLANGPRDAPLIIFAHGWPELSLSWRHQLAYFGARGWRAIAPDMRGYGRSTVHRRHEDYAVEESVADMLELLAHLGREQAIWVGHDWGSPVVWGLASHHPEKCRGVASLCVPHLPHGFSPETVIPLIDRATYPAEEYPVGQWDYQLFYRESFDKARSVFEANVRNTVKALFRKGDPSRQGTPNRLASVRRDGGWFGGKAAAPDLPMDTDLLTEEDLDEYAGALERNGFFGPDSWYMNAERNIAYAKRAREGGRLSMPVLFFHGLYDYTCETVRSKLAEPMREYCKDLTELPVPSGHWMAQEKPDQVNAGLSSWLATRFS